MSVEFEWDASKAKSNLAKHGVDFDEAATVFGDTLSVTTRDPRYSGSEPRLITIGSSHRGSLLVVAHVERDGRIRIISARRPTRKERRDYER